MNRSQLQDMLGGPVLIGPARRANGIARFWRSAGPHLWCALCTRTFPNGVHRLVGAGKTCPYADCSADIDSQAHAWTEIRRRHPDYPAAPWMAVQYASEPPAGALDRSAS